MNLKAKLLPSRRVQAREWVGGAKDVAPQLAELIEPLLGCLVRDGNMYVGYDIVEACRLVLV